MKTYQKILCGIGIAALTTAAVFPYAKSYVDSLPKKLTKEQAGERFLAIVCPSNRLNAQQQELMRKGREESSKRYYSGSAELANARVRIGALSNNIISLESRIGDAQAKAGKELADPKYVWPEDVDENIADLSTVFYEWARASKTNSEAGRPIQDHKSSDLPSEIRKKLGLPIRGQGC